MSNEIDRARRVVGEATGPMEAEFAIRMAMSAEGVSQRELAMRMGVAESRVSVMLRGNANLTVRTLERAAKALGCRLRITLDRDGVLA